MPADAIEAKLREGKHTDVAIREVTAEFIRENKDIYFNGNGYTDEWVAEAERRGLPNCKDMGLTPSSLLQSQRQ